MVTAMQAFVLLLAVGLVVAQYAPAPGYGGGHKAEDGHGNYDFGYGVKNAYGATNFRRESGNAHGQVVGSYGLTDIDGRERIVDYVADGYGFRAKVRTNEPGTKNEDPAAVFVKKDGYAPPPVPAAPVHPAPSYGYASAYGGPRYVPNAHYGGPVQYAPGPEYGYASKPVVYKAPYVAPYPVYASHGYAPPPPHHY